MQLASHEVVGREEELEALAAFVGSVSDYPAVLLLEGGAGIGKTTLWRETVALARASHRVLVTRPLEAEADLSFTGLGDLLDEVLDEALPHLPKPQRSALEVALLRLEGTTLPADPRAVGVALLGVLRTLGASMPVLVAVDDLQWLDLPSAHALQFALHRLTHEPIGVVLSSRAGERMPFDVGRLVPEPRLTRIDVAPLSSGAIARLVRARVGARLTRATLIRLHAVAGGNAFFALEIAAALERQGVEPGRGEPLPVPDSLTELLRDRLAQLPSGTRDALLAAAATASPTTAVISAVLRDNGSVTALEPAIEAGIVALDGDRVCFTHPLLASVVYRGALEKERRRMHTALADAVADLEERAVHLSRAAHGPTASVAATLEAAAAAARRRGAPESAAELAEEASRLTPPELVEDVARRKIDAAENHVQAGDLARARVLLEQATSMLQPGPVRARGLVALGIVEAHGASLWEESFATQEQALREVGDDGRLRAEIARQLGWMYAASRQALRAEPHARAALELAEGLEDRVLLAEALAAYANVEFQRGHGLRRDLFERALALDTLYEHPRVFRHPHWPLYMVLLWTGDHAGARSSLETLLQVALERGEENAPPWLLWALSEVELDAGNWDNALELSEQAHVLAVHTGQGQPRRNALEVRARIWGCRGETEAARALVEELLQTRGGPSDQIYARALLGLIELSLKNDAPAARHLTPLADEVRRAGVEDPSVEPFWPDTIEALIGCNKLDRAQPMLEWLDERGRTLSRPSAMATAARCRALLRAAKGDLEDALVAAEEALRWHGRFGNPFELGRTLLVKGKIARRAKQKRVARDALEQALEIFDRLGAVPWSRQARDEVARIGGRGSAGDELTPTEERVAALVAEGRSNREVAAALYVSENTIESHLSHVYAKLGLRSRTELARSLAQDGRLRAASP
jgi:ATP/maltotriose-dependent transcriptional regulator MalT